MNLHDAIEDAMAKSDLGSSFHEVLADSGFGDLPPDVLSTALQNYAESAPLSVADVLSPMVATASDVPFEPGEVAGATEFEAVQDQGGDIRDMLDEVGFDNSGLAGSFDEADPNEFDFDLDQLSTSAPDALGDALDAELPTFGVGDDQFDEDEADLSLEAPEHDEAAHAEPEVADLSNTIDLDELDEPVDTPLHGHDEVELPSEDGDVPDDFDEIE